jgi:hypothetical protein
MTPDTLRGHSILYENNQWVFVDTGLSVADTHLERPCGYCGEYNTEEGHDNCLGTLIGIMNACCGHGNGAEAYIQFLDGITIRGKDALIIASILKKYSSLVKSHKEV